MFRQVIIAVVFVSVCRACTYSPSCRSTYTVEVANGDPCPAAQTYQTCVGAMLAGCTSEQTMQSQFQDEITNANNAVMSYCHGGPPPPPADGGQPPPPPNTNDGGAPPPPPPQPTAPPQPTGCQLDATCESTYTTSVASGDACSASETFLSCISANADTCGSNIPSTITAVLDYARNQKAEKCNAPPPPVPGVPVCAQICSQYKDSALNLLSQGKISEGCSKHAQFISCLQNQASSCDTTAVIQESQAYSAAVCADPSNPGNCSTQFTACSTGLSSLQQSNALCDLWYVCKNRDFSSCGKTLTQNYDTQCANSPTPAPSTQNNNGNGSSAVGAGFLLAVFGYVISAMLQQ